MTREKKATLKILGILFIASLVMLRISSEMNKGVGICLFCVCLSLSAFLIIYTEGDEV